MSDPVTLATIQQARERIADAVYRTPTVRSRWMAPGGGPESAGEAFFKLECFQVTGSFKARGAFAKMSALNPDQKRERILTVSAGNHGLAVANAAELLGLQATIVVPRSASRAKVEAIRRYPVTLLELGESYDDAERAARRLECETGWTFISPYNDPDVIAGQGTVALEMLDDQPGLEAIVVPVGGGGLIAGVAIAAKASSQRIKVYGAESAASPTMQRALEAGRIVEIEEKETIADGLAGNIEPGSITFPIIQELVDGIIIVSEDAIQSAMRRVAAQDHIMIEGSAASGIAALGDPRLGGSRVAAIVTGRNITLDVFLGAVGE
jgi:threonine dehydratase